MYEPRAYRAIMNNPLKRKTVVSGESDLLVLYDGNIDGIRQTLQKGRSAVSEAILSHSAFQTSLVPIPDLPEDSPLVRRMKLAARIAGVGPMAAVAGAICSHVAEAHDTANQNLLIENGGDLYVKTSVPRLSLIHAGSHPMSNRLAIRITPEMGPVGICTSSGTMGHSLSFGKADAVVVVSSDVMLADACATALANRVQSAADIDGTLQLARTIPGLIGVVILADGAMGAWGSLDLTPYPSERTSP